MSAQRQEEEMSTMLRKLTELKKRNQNQKLFAGNVSIFDLDTETGHRFHMVKLISNGYVGLRVSQDSQEIMDKRMAKFAQLYQKDADCHHLKLGSGIVLEEGLFVIARILNKEKDRYIVLRGIVLGELGLADPDPKMVKILVVDELQIRNISRDALYNATPEFQTKSYLSTVAELDGIPEFLTANRAMYIKCMTGFIDENRFKEVAVRFVGEGEHFQKAVISLPGSGQTLGEIFMQKIISQALGKIPTKGKPALGSIVFAKSNGDVFIQMEESLMDDLVDYLAHHCRLYTGPEPTEVDINKMYIAPFDDDGWYRIKIEKVDQDKSEVRARYIDYGNHATIKISQLIPADYMDPLLAKIPPLCTRYHLKWVGKIEDLETFEGLFIDQYKLVIREDSKEGDPTSVVLFNTTKDEMDDMYCLNKYITDVAKIASRE